MLKLKLLRNTLGKSMAQVARELGIAYTTYVSYENGDREPNSEMLIILANYYGCSVDYLIDNTTQKEKPTPEGEPSEDLLVLHRNGKRIEYHLTPQQLAALKPLLDQLDSNSDSDI